MRVTQLPVGIVVGGVLQNEVVTTPMTGDDIDLILTESTSLDARFNQLILNRTDRIGSISDRKDRIEAVRSLCEEDRKAILMAIRIETYGPVIETDITCPSCKTVGVFSVDLSKVKFGLVERDETGRACFPFAHGEEGNRTTAKILLGNRDTDKIAGYLDSEEIKTPDDGNKFMDRSRRSIRIWLHLAELEHNGVKTTFARKFYTDVNGKPEMDDAAKAEIGAVSRLPLEIHTRLHDRIMRIMASIVPLQSFKCGHAKCGKEVKLPIPFGNAFFDPLLEKPSTESSSTAPTDSDGLS